MIGNLLLSFFEFFDTSWVKNDVKQKYDLVLIAYWNTVHFRSSVTVLIFQKSMVVFKQKEDRLQ